MAESLNAYTLTDTGTYLNLVRRGKLGELSVLLEEPGLLLNIYSMYVSNSPQYALSFDEPLNCHLVENVSTA